tara:strand:- start:648 stop:923 length:276 start_codon:yes stop_codon:yes gene_type:complete
MTFTDGKNDYSVDWTQSKRKSGTTRRVYVQRLGKPERKDGTTVRKFVGGFPVGVNLTKIGKQWKIEGYQGTFKWQQALSYAVNIAVVKHNA